MITFHNNIISLSQVSEKEDLSVVKVFSNIDEEYFNAISNHDMSKVNKMILNKSKENGYVNKMWHGGTFNLSEARSHEHGNATYVTNNQKLASQYGDAHEIVYKGKILDGEQKPTEDFIFNFVDVADSMGYHISDREISLSFRPSTIFVSIQELCMGMKNRREDANNILRSLGYVGESYDEESSGVISIAFFVRSAVKLLDPITYDHGSIIPLSKRFDSSNDDIKY